MNEFVEIYSSNGKKTGKKELLSIAHQKGYAHATVHLWLFTNSGNLVIQKRSINKKSSFTKILVSKFNQSFKMK